MKAIEKLTDQIFESGIPPEDTRFSKVLFHALIALYEKRKKTDLHPIEEGCKDSFFEISELIDQSHLQDSTSFRMIKRAEWFASVLIKDDGTFVTQEYRLAGPAEIIQTRIKNMTLELLRRNLLGIEQYFD